MIETKYINRRRLVYSVEELTVNKIVDWTKPVAVIGDGESRCKYIFNRERVTAFAINRAARIYPADFMVTWEGHFSIMDAITEIYIPIVIIKKTDSINVIPYRSATALIFTSYLAQKLKGGTIILQGFNFSNKPTAWGMAMQKKGFYGCKQFCDKNGIDLFLTHKNKILDFIPVRKPKSELYL